MQTTLTCNPSTSARMGSLTDGAAAATGEIHILMYPWPAAGHINPFAQLACKLAATAPLPVRITFLSFPANAPAIAARLPSSPAVTVLSLTLPHVPGLPAGTENTAGASPAAAELLKSAIDLTRPAVTDILDRLRPHAIIYDFSQPWVPDIARPLGVKSLFFSLFGAVSTAYLTIPSRRSCADSLERPPPGFPAGSSIRSVPKYQAEDFAYMFKRFEGAPSVYDRVVGCFHACDAIVMRTCTEMERMYIDYVESEFKKPGLLAGPVIPEPPADELKPQWAGWLDSFPVKSVIFCSFGSEAFLSDDDIREVLLGLEMTSKPFFLKLNVPKGEMLKQKIPAGFNERVRERAVVHTGWVQQQKILQHGSVGCFVSHAGMNSLMEGLAAGCQLVLLPQFGDQFFNTAIFAGDQVAAVEVEREPKSGVFTAGALCAAVRKVMEVDGEEAGRTVRENKKKWREFLMDEQVQGKLMGELCSEVEGTGWRK